jgi:hemolysin activation/secretion protein
MQIRLLRIFFKCHIVFLILLNVFCIPNAHSQSIPESVRREAQRLQERERERIQDREKIFRDSQITPPSGSDITLDSTKNDETVQCLKVDKVNLIGVTHYKSDKFKSDADGLLGECTSTSQIDDVLRIITNRYISDGYITSRALRSPTKEPSGTLEILVIEGRLAKISAPNDNQRPRYDSELISAFPGMKGRHLNLRDIEQGVDQLARLSGSDPQIDIVPGELPATSDLVVRRRISAPWVRPSVTINNDGSASTGRQQATVSIDIDSPFGAADFWSFYYIRDLNREAERGALGYGAFYSLPYGYTTLILSGGRYQYTSVLQSNDLAFLNTGDSINGSIGFDHLLYRDGKTKLSVSANLSFYDTVNRIQDIRLSTNSYRVISGEISFRAQRRVGDGLILAEIGLTRGFNIFGANAADIGPGSDGLKFRKIDASLAYQSRMEILGVPTDYSSTFRGQVALDPLLPAERFSVGGSSTVRGFRDDGISGQRGFAFRQQLSVGLFKLFTDTRANSATQLAAIFGYDAGGILPKRGDSFERGFLQSSIVGLRMINRRLQAEVSAAVPLSAPKTLQPKRLEFTASVRLTI